jgi:hypothetical protein
VVGVGRYTVQELDDLDTAASRDNNRAEMDEDMQAVAVHALPSQVDVRLELQGAEGATILGIRFKSG